MDILEITGFAVGVVGFLYGIVIRAIDKKEMKRLQDLREKSQKSLQDKTVEISILQKSLAEKQQEIEKTLKKNERNKDIEFFKVQPEETNDKFYQFFGNKIRHANKSIFLTGRGITNLNKGADYKIAQNYCENFKHALRNKESLNVTRVQFSDRADKKWYELWYEVWKIAPNRVHFFILDSPEALTANSPWHDMVHVAAIDFNSLEDCVSEFMIPVHKDEPGEGTVEMAGSALFIEKNTSLSENIKKRIFLLTLSSQCRRIDSKPKWEEEIKKGS